MITWQEIKKEIELSPEDINAIKLEEDLIQAVIDARKKSIIKLCLESR